MTTPTTTCINCNRTDMEVPLIAWRYQGQDLTICSDCLPMLIHHRERLMAKQANGAAEEPLVIEHHHHHHD